MFFLNKPSLWYLTSKSLEIVLNNRRYTCPFPPDVVQHLELVNEEKFKQNLLVFLKQLPINESKVVIYLAPILVFTSEESTKNKDENGVVENFLSSVPIAKNNIAKVEVKTKDRCTIYVTNTKFFEAVIEICNQKSIEVSSVVPVNAVLQIPKDTTITIQDLRMIDTNQVVKQFDFLQDKHPSTVARVSTPTQPVSTEATNHKIRNQYIVLIICLFLLGAALLYLLQWSGTLSLPSINPSQDTQPIAAEVTTPTPVVTTQPTPTINSFDKSAIAIRILNGSGIVGQAGELSQLLQDAGYKNTTTGNATNSAEIGTIRYSNNVTLETVQDIVTTLQINLTPVTMQEATQSAEFDVIIITGKK